MMKVIGIYHSADLDGFTSGAIIKKNFPEAQLIGWDYGNPIPNLPDGARVIMSDISFPIEEMVAIGNRCKLLWIDHHISAIKAYEEYCEKNGGAPFEAYVETKLAACELTWMYFNPDYEWNPESVKLLGTYDSWRDDDKNYWENYVLPYQYGMRLICNSVDTFPVGVLENNHRCVEIIQKGETVLKYQRQQNKIQCRKASFEIEWNGLRCICLNGGSFNSLAFDYVYRENKHDVMMPFQFNGKKWTVSLYSTKEEIDCSEIAKTMGGGGHKGAAGFQIDDITKIIGTIE
jgi:oligoribonuclease NrnB/cAMP/cGMP phosphodiesterase (DHH superfamily)